ncbi:MAG TPA: DUF3455 domain-containing protein [Acidobacteriaceae bacterium]|jgi:hypothetical protein
MFLETLLDLFLTPSPQRPGNINPSQVVGYSRKTSDKTPSSYARRLWMIAFVLPVACLAPHSIAQTAKESIDVPPHSRLLLRAVGSGDQVYGCVDGSWVLKAPDAKLLNEEGSVIGRHFAGPTWQLNDGSWVKGKAIAKQVAPDATAVPWLLLESLGGTGRLGAVRFIQRTETHGGNAPNGSCSQSAIRRVPYTATYSFYEGKR